METRRAFLSQLCASAASPAAAAGTRSDTFPTWLKSHTNAVRTVDFADDDFSDLEPLGDAVGAARVVQLGEPSHGAGSAFAAKARVVRFLHQHLGFDVLIWESGLYDVALAQAQMRSSVSDAVTAARTGLFSLWSQAAEVRPLFEYIKASQPTLRPLDMAGFDLQVTADGTRERFARDLRDFVAALRDPVSRQQATSLAEQALAARERLFVSKFSGSGDLKVLTTAVRALRTMMDRGRDGFEAVHGRLETSFMSRAVENMRADAALRSGAARSPATTPARESRRDALNAANLRWLIEERYAGRKVMVWAHNAHVMNAYYAPGFHDVHLKPQPGDMKPTGVFVKDWLGDQVYTVGITAYAGQEGFAVGGPVSAIAPAREGSLEAQLHASGDKFAFLDLRAAGKKHPGPLHGNLAVRIPKFDTVEVPDLGRIYDGIFFIDQIAAATHI